MVTDDYMTAEAISREQLRELQATRLREAVRRASASDWYGPRLADIGISPNDIAGPADVCRLPLTTKDDLRAGMPYGFLAVPLTDVVRTHYSSGTTGIATGVCHTRNDLQYWSECVARGMRAVGVTADDVFQNMMGYGLFTGGLGFHYASELIGCMTIPASSGNTQRQVHLMQVYSTSVIHILPNYAVRVAAYCEEIGLDPREDLNISIAFVGGEPHSQQLVRRIEDTFGCKVYNCYGLSEMCGPGVAMECTAQDGLHVREDHYLVEILDPVSLEPVAPGERGELVLTTLTREAMPLLRYRTRDITRIVPGECPCGCGHVKIDRIQGRSDDMLIVKGVNIYPQQVERVLMQAPEVGTNYLIIIDENDNMTVRVELSASVPIDEMRRLYAIEQRLIHDLRSEILITPTIELVQPNALPVGEGKAVRVEDRREQS